VRQLNVTGDESKPDSAIGQIQEFAQDKQFTLSETVLDASMISEREIKIQKVSGTVKLVTKIDGTIYTVTLS